MQLRDATLNDIPALLQLEQDIVDAERPYNRDIKSDNAHYYDLHKLLSQPNSIVKVIELNGNIIATGYVEIRPSKTSLTHAEHGYLGFMFVHEQHRGKGLNQQIMSSLIAWAKQQGMTHFYLDVYAQNQGAIKAYEKLGFEPALLEMKLCEL